MKRLLMLLTVISLIFSCSETEYLPLPFIKLLNRSKMVFIEPDGYKRMTPGQNEQMNWELAYIHPHKKFEIRYAIRPMDTLLIKYHSAIDSLNMIINPNELYQSTFKATLLNISGEQSPNYTIFSPNAAKNEFHADWVATAIVNVAKDFGQDYKYCFMVFIHKNDIGDAYIFCLADDLTLLNNEMKPIIHNLKFESAPKSN